MKTRHRFLLVLIVCLLVAVGLGLSVEFTDKNYSSHTAIAESGQILLACEVYCRHPDSGGKYPSTLSDLVKPPFGGDSFLRDGEHGLLDPWGKPYKYAIVNKAQGEPELYVWTKRLMNGKLKLLGAKMSEGGKIEQFGVPE